MREIKFRVWDKVKNEWFPVFRTVIGIILISASISKIVISFNL